ncbi:nitroreductase/quinone reductase family protein [Nocardia sp. NPDC050630]|uniref:nitroreductase/quinone reductase family protein n=1 Tax=Nocardia sp. NPDC050630 TaxID=3364321 RepID=UPI0037877DBD
MSFDSRNGTRGRPQPKAGPLHRLINGLAAKWARRGGKFIGGMDGLVLTTVGRRTGAERATPVAGYPDENGGWLILATAGGPVKNNPAWYYNLAANPARVSVDVAGRKLAVTAEQLHGAERAEAWQMITAAVPSFAKIQEQTDRQLPVIRLKPRTV